MRYPYIKIGFALLIYLFGVPHLWPAPTIEIRIPDQTITDDSLEFEVIVNTWHTNYLIHRLSFHPDTREDGHPDGSQGFTVIKQVLPIKKSWPFFKLNRISWYRSRVHRFSIPPGTFHEGMNSGKIYATILFAKTYSYDLGLWIGHPVRTKTQTLEIQVEKE